MSDSTRIEELRKEIESLCGNCDRPNKEEIGNIILSAMVLGFNEGLKVSSADRAQGEWKHLGGDEWLCSECGYVIWTEGSWEHPLERGKDYCEHCGARMKG